ncbi:GNAT family N-acetyltransferase [Qipengyuania sp. RANM35]|uniref:GNAT family N-acetyltransferase n=1 Tax=Qipengyuania sp. RANM35 TaxID=3068635 RepID=UPI0034DB55F2
MNYHSTSFGNGLTVTADVVRPAELDPALLSAWQQLRAGRSCYSSPFYDPAFTLAVGAVRMDARVAIFTAGGEVVGFLPFHRVGRAIAKPIGGHINDYQGAILRRDIDHSDPALLSAAAIAAYDFNHLPAEFAARSATVRGGGTSPVMDLAGGYAAYLASRGKDFHKRQAPQRRKLRKLEREFGTTTFVFDSMDQAHLSAHTRMRNELYLSMGMKAQFAKGWQGEVFAELRRAKAGTLRTTLSILCAGGEPVAAHFGMISLGVLHWWFPAYDARASRCSPGLSLLEACAEQAQAEEVFAIDFGRGDEAYKKHYATREVQLLAGSFTRPATLASAVRTVGQRTLDPLERRLPKSLNSYPRRIADRLVTGVGIPRFG